MTLALSDYGTRRKKYLNCAIGVMEMNKCPFGTLAEQRNIALSEGDATAICEVPSIISHP